MRDFLQRNFWLKVFSLVLAALIWYVLQSNLQTGVKYPENPFRPLKIREFSCPVTLLMSPADRTQFKVEPPEVVVKVQGEGAILEGMASAEVQPYVNVTSVKNAQGGFKVEAILPRGVNLRSIVPAFVIISSPTNLLATNLVATNVSGTASAPQLH